MRFDGSAGNFRKLEGVHPRFSQVLEAARRGCVAVGTDRSAAAVAGARQNAATLGLECEFRQVPGRVAANGVWRFTVSRFRR